MSNSYRLRLYWRHHYVPMAKLNAVLVNLSDNIDLFQTLLYTYLSNPSDYNSTVICLPVISKVNDSSSLLFARDYYSNEEDATRIEEKTMRYSLIEIKDILNYLTVLSNCILNNSI